MIKSPFCTVSVISVLIPYSFIRSKGCCGNQFLLYSCPSLNRCTGQIKFLNVHLERKQQWLNKLLKRHFRTLKIFALNTLSPRGNASCAKHDGGYHVCKRQCIRSENILKTRAIFIKAKSLGHCCTTDDKAVWIKSIPAQVAEPLGYDILPAIAALTNDSLSKRDTDATLDIANGMAKALLKDCERQESRLKGGISAEYDMMKTGYSEVHGLLVEADRIAEDALQVS